jgi:hypothetical protein
VLQHSAVATICCRLQHATSGEGNTGTAALGEQRCPEGPTVGITANSCLWRRPLLQVLLLCVLPAAATCGPQVWSTKDPAVRVWAVLATIMMLLRLLLSGPPFLGLRQSWGWLCTPAARRQDNTVVVALACLLSCYNAAAQFSCSCCFVSKPPPLCSLANMVGNHDVGELYATCGRRMQRISARLIWTEIRLGNSQYKQSMLRINRRPGAQHWHSLAPAPGSCQLWTAGCAGL